MPLFYYTAKESPTKVIDGTIEAPTKDAAVFKVMQLGLAPLDVILNDEVKTRAMTKVSRQPVEFRLFKRVGVKDVVQFTQEMSDLVGASVTVPRSLQIIGGQTENSHFQPVIKEMHEFVRNGGSFSNALAQHPKIFSRLYVNLVRSGEVSGSLTQVMQRLADYLDKEYETGNKIKASLAYPFLILGVGIVTMFVLMAFVVPNITVMFEDLGQELPLITQILTFLGDFFGRYWWAVFLGVGALGFYLFRWLQTGPGRHWLDATLLKIPVMGSFLRVAEVGRFSRTLGTLLETGVVITTALQTVKETIENSILREEIQAASEDVTKGTSLRQALVRHTSFPEMALNMIAVGEETGNLESSLYKIANTYERVTDQKIKTLVSIIGPVVLIVIVAFVGFVVVGMLLPIFQMNLIVQ